jgi:cell division septal protein FtsQ
VVGGRAGARAGRTQSRSIRRRSAGLTPTRAGALLALLAAIAALYGAMSSDAFAARRTEITGTTWTPRDAVLAALAVPSGQNLFTLNTHELEARLAAIPAIRGASVSVALPDEVRVDVAERKALLAWAVGPNRYLVDDTGTLFGELGDASPPEAAQLPVVEDTRAGSAGLAVGSVLDPVDLDAALRLGSLRPADLGSAASRLAIRIDDQDGFSVRAEPDGWTAVFGFYTPTLRTTELVPGQVRLLRSMLAGREDDVLRVILADDRSGTYIPRGGASAAPSSAP